VEGTVSEALGFSWKLSLSSSLTTPLARLLSLLRSRACAARPTWLAPLSNCQRRGWAERPQLALECARVKTTSRRRLRSTTTRNPLAIA